MPAGSPVLVANRGEIAVRVVRAVHASGGRAVAVHAADDDDAPHVRRADAAVRLPGTGPAAYLDVVAVVAAATASGCRALHPGYGLLSESAELARACAREGVTFVGPSPDLLELFGDKARARAHARARGVPVLPGTGGGTGLEEAVAFAAAHGPVMVKALAGGGGRGLRAVMDPAGLPEAYAQAAAEARLAGDGALYVEQLLDRPRHLEVQVLGDGTGAVVSLGERDCSTQRRHQKLVEVAPCPRLDDGLRGELVAAALRLTGDLGYAGLGTVEFLVQGRAWWFLEVNPRVQVEHTVTEEVTGVDLVAAQLAVASGRRLADLGLQDPPAPRGVALQLRVNAETLTADGAPVPAAGRLTRFDLPGGPGVRVDTASSRGDRVDPRYDSLLAKVVVHGADLAQATARATAALEELAVEGVATNADLLHGLLSTDAFHTGAWDTGLLGEHLGGLLAHRRPGQADPGPARTAPARAAATAPPGAVVVLAPGPGVVVRLEAGPGSRVAAGRPVVVVEAMKMEHVLRAPAGLRVEAVLVGVGDVVEAGAVLAHGVPDDVEEDPAGEHDPEGPGDWSAELAEVARRRQSALAMGGPAKLARQHAEGKLDARRRIEALVDPGSFAEIGALAGFAPAGFAPAGFAPAGFAPAGAAPSAPFTPANFIAGTARLDGRKVVLGVDDFTLRGGSGDAAIHAKQVFAEHYARELRLPVVRLLDGASGGGSVKMALDAGWTYVPVNPGWDAVVDLSLVPVVAAALGPTVGLGAARLVMSHLSVLVEGVGQLFTAGPPVVLAATGERLTKEELGGADVHRANGAVERVVPDEQAAFAVLRRFLSYLPGSVFELPPVVPTDDPVSRRDPALLGVVPRDTRRPYDVATVLAGVFDAGSVFRYADYGGGTLTALARLDGHPVGVLAADPAQGATLSAEGAQAVTRLVDLCQTFHLPLVSLTDQAGMTIGRAAERAATIRHGARAVTAVYQARVPQCELIVRRVYGVGGAGIVDRHRALRSWAWPSGDWGSLPSRGGVEAAFRAQIAAAPDPAAELDRLSAEVAAVASPFRTAEHFGVQDIIDPRDSRPLLCDWVRDAYRVLPEQLGRPSFGTRP